MDEIETFTAMFSYQKTFPLQSCNEKPFKLTAILRLSFNEKMKKRNKHISEIQVFELARLVDYQHH